jgi:hypothetical protein
VITESIAGMRLVERSQLERVRAIAPQALAHDPGFRECEIVSVASVGAPIAFPAPARENDQGFENVRFRCSVRRKCPDLKHRNRAHLSCFAA